jgi:cobalt/nickel transport system permease protein
VNDSGNRHSQPDVRLPAGDRAALSVLALFILFVAAVPKNNLPAVIAYGSFPAFAIFAARLPLKLVFWRILALLPFVLFMAAGNLYFDREPAFNAGRILVTGGMISGSVIAVKSLVTLATLHVFSLCMPFHRFGSALRAFGVPAVFVTQLQLVYRYSFLLAGEARSLQKARDLRSFGGKGKELRTAASLIGSLLLRSSARADRIYMAMCSRGFENRMPVPVTEPFTARDAGVALLSVSGFVLIRILFVP